MFFFSSFKLHLGQDNITNLFLSTSQHFRAIFHHLKSSKYSEFLRSVSIWLNSYVRIFNQMSICVIRRYLNQLFLLILFIMLFSNYNGCIQWLFFRLSLNSFRFFLYFHIWITMAFWLIELIFWIYALGTEMYLSLKRIFFDIFFYSKLYF